MGREVKSKTRGQLWEGTNERSKWDKKLRLHPPGHIEGHDDFVHGGVMFGLRGSLKKSWGKKSPIIFM